MKLFLITFFGLLAGVNKSPANLRGTFGWQSKSVEGPYALLQIHYTAQNAILFYFEKGVGAPSYDSGSTYGQLTYNKKSGCYEYVQCNAAMNCKLEFFKVKNGIRIKTLKGDCEYGATVSADGYYQFKERKNPEYFDDRHGYRMYFDKTSPEKYRP
jgi:hypothetical protein